MKATRVLQPTFGARDYRSGTTPRLLPNGWSLERFPTSNASQLQVPLAIDEYDVGNSTSNWGKIVDVLGFMYGLQFLMEINSIK